MRLRSHSNHARSSLLALLTRLTARGWQVNLVFIVRLWHEFRAPPAVRSNPVHELRTIVEDRSL